MGHFKNLCYIVKDQKGLRGLGLALAYDVVATLVRHPTLGKLIYGEKFDRGKEYFKNAEASLASTQKRKENFEEAVRGVEVLKKFGEEIKKNE